jgi:hypothetical protein
MGFHILSNIRPLNIQILNILHSIVRNYADNIVMNKLFDTIWSPVYNQIWSNVYNQACVSGWEQIINQHKTINNN